MLPVAVLEVVADIARLEAVLVADAVDVALDVRAAVRARVEVAARWAPVFVGAPGR